MPPDRLHASIVASFGTMSRLPGTIAYTLLSRTHRLLPFPGRSGERPPVRPRGAVLVSPSVKRRLWPIWLPCPGTPNELPEWRGTGARWQDQRGTREQLEANRLEASWCLRWSRDEAASKTARGLSKPLRYYPDPRMTDRV